MATPRTHTTASAGPKRARRISARGTAVAAAGTLLALVAGMSAGPAQAYPGSWDMLFYQGILRNWGTGHCLDAFANVNPCYDNGTDAWQQWYVNQQPNGQFRIQNAHTGACLDNGAGLYMYPNCVDGDTAQYWILLAGNQYQGVFQNALTGECLDDNGQLYMNTCNLGGYQTWRWDGSMG